MVATVKALDFKSVLKSKLGAVLEPRGGDDYYIVQDEEGHDLASTSFSRKSNETLGPGRVAQMSRQLHLDSKDDVFDLIDCPLSKEAALAKMKKNWPPGSSRLKR